MNELASAATRPPSLQLLRPRTLATALGVSPEAVAISKELKKRGMKFVGPTIIHALLQAVGVYDEHAKACFRAKRV